MRYFWLSLLLGLASAVAATPADTARTNSSRQARQRQARLRHAERSCTSPEIYQGRISRQLDWLGDSSAVTSDTDSTKIKTKTKTPTSAPKGATRLLSPRAQSRAIARERIRQGWGKQYRE